MSRLVPEKRQDRNGRLVTRHVLAEASTPGHPPLPAATVAAGSRRQREKALKLRPEQVERTVHALRIHDTLPSESLIGTKAWNEARWHSAAFRFEASEAEAFDVLSVVDRPIDALPLLAQGITTAAQAIEHLRGKGLNGLLGNRSEFAQACLKRRVPVERVFEICDYKDEILLRDGDPRGVADSIAFRLTPLGEKTAVHLHGRHVIEDMGRGTVSLDDIKAVGFGRLSAFNRLPALHGIFQQIGEGEGDWTTQALRDLIDRSAAEQLGEFDWQRIGRMCERHGPEQMAEVGSLWQASAVYSSCQSSSVSPRSFTDADAARIAVYCGQIGTGLGTGIHWTSAVPFFDDGIPVETAREVLTAGGDVRAARAILDGIEPGLAGGWL